MFMVRWLREAFSFMREVFSEWSTDKTSLLAASIAYYATFSIGPALLIAISIVGPIYGEDVARQEVYDQMSELVGESGADFIRVLINNASDPVQSQRARLIGIGTLFLAATGIFKQFQDAINIAWDVYHPPEKTTFLGGLWRTVRKRLVSFLMLGSIGILLLMSLLLTTAIASIDSWLTQTLPEAQLTIQVFNQTASFLVITLILAVMYRTLPDVPVTWNDVLAASMFTAFMFTIGKYALGSYLGNTDYSSTYGAAGSFVLILAWIYYSAQILLFGAEFCQVYAHRYGSQIEPSYYSTKSHRSMPIEEEVEEAT